MWQKFWSPQYEKAKPNGYGWNVRNLVSALCKMTCVCPVKVNGNTWVWNSCDGSRVKPLALWDKKKKKKRQEIGLYCMQVHQQEARTKYLLPAQVLVTAFSFTFGMLEKNLSKPAEGINTYMTKETLETMRPCCDQLTTTSCAWAWQCSAWAWNWDQGFPCSAPAVHTSPLHTFSSFHQVFSCAKCFFQSRVLATLGGGK